MDVTFMNAVISSSTSMLTSLVGALFTFLTAILPILLGIAALGFAVWGVRRVLGSFRGARRG